MVSSGAGLGKNLVVTVTPEGQERNIVTLEDAFIYDEPIISVIRPNNLPSQEEQSQRFLGTILLGRTTHQKPALALYTALNTTSVPSQDG